MPDGSTPKPAKISQAKGKPWIHWVGKRGIEEIAYFPAQETERFNPHKEMETGAWSNLLFHGDNKEVMGHLLHQFRGQVDLVYIDPPFDSKADYVRKVQLRGGGSKQLVGEEQSLLEQVQYNDLWANDEYLQFMYERLILLRELMAETGSIYLHCDWHQSHRLRCLMDEVFGTGNFLAQIVWRRSLPKGNAVGKFANSHDIIYLYKKSEDYVWNQLYTKHRDEYIKEFYKYEEPDGRTYRLVSCISPNPNRPNLEYEWKGIKKVWRFEKSKMEAMDRDGLLVYSSKGTPSYKTYLDGMKGTALQDIWIDIFPVMGGAIEESGYPTQKPEKLLARIIEASSNPGDLVLDIFSGSGTTGAVAQKLDRRWILADINHGAIQTISKRLQDTIRAITNGDLHTKGAGRNFRIVRVNDYDLQIQHNEALEFAIDKIGIQRTPQDGFFEGTVGDRLVKIIPLNRPANIADLDSIEREIAEIRPDDTRDILVVALGAETNVHPWIEEKNKLRQHAKNNRYELKDLRETGFFEHRPAEAEIAVKKEDGKVRVEIKDFHSPTICARLDIENKKAVIRAEIPDFRSQIDCVLRSCLVKIF